MSLNCIWIELRICWMLDRLAPYKLPRALDSLLIHQQPSVNHTPTLAPHYAVYVLCIGVDSIISLYVQSGFVRVAQVVSSGLATQLVPLAIASLLLYQQPSSTTLSTHAFCANATDVSQNDSKYDGLRHAPREERASSSLCVKPLMLSPRLLLEDARSYRGAWLRPSYFESFWETSAACLLIMKR